MIGQIVSTLPINWSNPLTVGGTGATLKLFPSIPNTSKYKRGYVLCPGFNQANGRRLYFRANGNYQSTSPVMVGLYTTKTPDDPKSIYAIDTEAFSGADVSPWMITAEMAGDSASKIVQINYQIQSLGLGAVKRNIIQNVDFSLDIPFVFIVGLTFSVSAAKNTASMFQCDLLI